jgi:hypothetical protein
MGFSLFVKKNFWTTNVNKDNIHYDVKGKICNFLNTYLHETLFPHPSIILIAFLYSKNYAAMQWVSPKYNSIAHSQVKKSVINNFLWQGRHVYLGISNYITGLT